jgi:hypothetical protein
MRAKQMTALTAMFAMFVTSCSSRRGQHAYFRPVRQHPEDRENYSQCAAGNPPWRSTGSYGESRSFSSRHSGSGPCLRVRYEGPVQCLEEHAVAFPGRFPLRIYAVPVLPGRLVTTGGEERVCREVNERYS